MRFSVIIPVYNCEKTLHISVDSIRQQTYTDWELILVNDGSKDNSLPICQQYAEADSRIVVIDQSNAGAGAARNKGIKVARGEYLVFCDADDFYNNNALECLEKNIVSYHSDLVIGSYNEYRYLKDGTMSFKTKSSCSLRLNGSEEIKNNYITLYRQALITAPWCKAYKKNIVIENNIQFPNIRRCQDIIFNLYFYEYINSLNTIEDVVYNYHTPDADTYLKKFPIDMFEINKQVYSSIKEKLSSWGVLSPSIISYFDSRFVIDTSIILRLNYENNWNMDWKKRLFFSKQIVNDSYLKSSLDTRPIDKRTAITRLILKSKNQTLIFLFSSLSSLYINLI